MRHTLEVVLAIAALFAVVLSAACSPASAAGASAATDAPPTPAGELVTEGSQIVGIWRTFNDHCDSGYLFIRQDQTLTVSCNADGSRGSSEKYRFDGDQFVTQGDFCGSEQHYQVHRSQDASGRKSLVFTVVQADCGAEIKTLTTRPATWESALP